MSSMTDKLLLWPLLFDGGLHYTGQDLLQQAIASATTNNSGCGWWATVSGRGYSTGEDDQKWLYGLWQRQEKL